MQIALSEFGSWELPAFVCATALVIGSYVVFSRIKNLSRPAGIPALKDSSTTTKFRLVERVETSKAVYRLRFALHTDSEILGLPIGKHVALCAHVGNPLVEGEYKQISRQYTPITSDFQDRGYFDLLVKVYRKNENARFPEGGWMSQHLEALPIGSDVEFRGPNGRIEYLERGHFKLGHSKRYYKKIAMIAGGTGITPMYQLIKHVLVTMKGSDSLDLTLLFGNQTPRDILLRDELETLCESNPKQFKLHLTVDRVPKGEAWEGSQGFVTKEMIEATIPRPSNYLLVLLCGPPMMTKSVQSILAELEYSKDNVHAF
jgi:NAD(P)H-flavin reductase